MNETLKFLGGYRVLLTGKLPAKNRFLPISAEDTINLLARLENEGDYTYMSLQDGRSIEVIKVQNYCGRLLITRGLEGTRTLSFRCDTCLEHIITPTAVREYVCQNLTELQECRDNG